MLVLFCISFLQANLKYLLNHSRIHLWEANSDDSGSLPSFFLLYMNIGYTFEPRHEISNNVVCAISKASDQPAHTSSLIRAFASRLNILGVFSY